MKEEPLMCFDQTNQLKVPWENYQSRQGRAILKQMTPEQKQHLSELVQARILLDGKQVRNPELYKGLLASTTLSAGKGLTSD